ncbi:paraquat-inducible protein A [Rhodocyclus purpureus]|uniref:paraquat-inducible protein A n=1 Tax=Rhodocyclus purpureus TaxID=1067 RepID=UPI0019126D05|nr:paraquat-inducible protein A [Rhodocyclus purpureus]MBK5914562.1 paraquat-inducible protein A [Rhodocyclus purpureus]
MSARLTVCHECDALLQEVPQAEGGGNAICPRCGAGLYRLGPDKLQVLLALSLSALILLLLSNLFPVVGLNIQGHQVETTVFGAAGQLWRDDMPVVAGLLLATTVLIPLIEMLALAWMLLPLCLGRRPPAFVLLFRGLRLAQPWAMVEVFILGVLVSLVKLSHLADVLPGTAIWCFGALMLVLAVLSSLLDHRVLWRAWEAAR